jgi:hypothetical protein
VIGRRSAWNGRIGRTSVATRGACPGDCALASRACGYWDLLVPLSVAGFAILKTYGGTHSRRVLARARLRRPVRNSSGGARAYARFTPSQPPQVIMLERGQS